MIAPFGFDVTGFMPRQGSPAVDMAKTALGASAEQNAITQRAIENLARQKMAEQQLAFDRDQMAEQARQADMIETGRTMRQEQELQQAAYLDALKRAEAQRALEGGIVGDATKAFGVGDLTGVESLQQRAKIQAPALSFQLPGSLPPANEMGIADPFASPMAGLSISRGGETLYSGDTAEMRRRNQEVVQSARGALTGGPEGDAYAPYLAAGIGMAGLGGISGADALKAAREQGDKAAQREAYREGQRMLSVRQDASQVRSDVNAQRDRWGDLHNMAKGIAKSFEGDVKLNEMRTANANLGGIRQQISSGIPLSENMGQLQLLKSNTRGAISDYETKQNAAAAGKLLEFEKTLNMYLNGGKMPEGFQAQLLDALDLVDAYQQSHIRQMGLRAADGVYRAPGFMAQVESPEQAAYFGLQAYQDVSHDSDITDEDYAEEADRIRPMFMRMKGVLGPTAVLPSRGGSSAGGSGGTSVSIKGDIVPPGVVGDLGGLGSGLPVPKIPNAGPAPDPAVQRAIQLMGGGNAR